MSPKRSLHRRSRHLKICRDLRAALVTPWPWPSLLCPDFGAWPIFWPWPFELRPRLWPVDCRDSGQDSLLPPTHARVRALWLARNYGLAQRSSQPLHHPWCLNSSSGLAQSADHQNFAPLGLARYRGLVWSPAQHPATPTLSPKLPAFETGAVLGTCSEACPAPTGDGPELGSCPESRPKMGTFPIRWGSFCPLGCLGYNGHRLWSARLEQTLTNVGVLDGYKSPPDPSYH